MTGVVHAALGERTNREGAGVDLERATDEGRFRLGDAVAGAAMMIATVAKMARKRRMVQRDLEDAGIRSSPRPMYWPQE